MIRCSVRPSTITWLALFSVMALAGCSSNPARNDNAVQEATDQVATHRLQYCARYLIYEMCALDMNRDGSADALYFDDTKEVFMFDPHRQTEVLAEFDLHPCVQIMDKGMKEASSRLLGINDQTSLLKKLSLQRALLSHYARYSDRVRECKEALSVNQMPDEPFGDPSQIF